MCLIIRIGSISNSNAYVLEKSKQESTIIPTLLTPNEEILYLPTQWILGKTRGKIMKTSQNKEVIHMINMQVFQ